MAKAKQLPSGQWRTLVYSHTEIIDGKKKRIYESFTADTKKESEFLAAKFAMDKNSVTKANMTVEKAINTYIDTKSNILSPSTIRTYRLNAKNHLNGIKHISVDKLSSVMVQAEINELSGKGLSPKTIRNVYGLLVSALKEARPDLNIKCVLPQKIKPEITIPTTEELNKLISSADEEMALVIKIAAFMGLRRSEICAITEEDIDQINKKLYISKAKVLGNNNQYVIKGTKTTSGKRILDIPDIIADEIRPVVLEPHQISDRFIDIVKKCGLKCRFHDLRHYYASVMLLLGIPDKYAMERMGHATNNMLKTVYQHTFDSEQSGISSKLNDFFKSNSN